MLLAATCGLAPNFDDIPPRQCLPVLHGVSDRGRAENQLRPRAMVLAEREKPADHVGDVRPEVASILMNFVEDDVFEPWQKLDPVFVVREKGIVKTVGIRDQNVRRSILESAPHLLLRITVERPGAYGVLLRQIGGEPLNGEQLIVGKSLCGIEV